MSESRIYTKLGDDGSTGLLYGGRTSKADPLVDTLGSLDETVAALGLARASATDPTLAARILQIQRDLFVAAADLAASAHARDRLVPEVSLVTAAMTARIETLIDQMIAQRPLRPVFVVPGANATSAALDLGRTIVRRAERRLVACQAPPGLTQQANPHVLTYLNRVSDLLYVLARHAAGEHEEPLSHEALDPNGLNTLTSEFSVKESIDRMVSVIEGEGWHLFARIDHAEHARKKGLELRPTELILFGNPEIGTLLMQDRQLVGIDLPVKALAWEDERGQVRIAHNSMQWLKQRHRLTDEATVKTIAAVLAKVCASAQTRGSVSPEPR